MTLAELGRLLGLDKSTVSLALRDSPKISPETRARVHALAQQHAYRPNLAARQLTAGKGLHLIALALPRSLRALSSPVAVRTIQELAHLSAQHGALLNLMVGDAAPSLLRPDAMVVWGDVPLAEARILAGHGRPWLVLDPNHASYASYRGPAVWLDDAGGGADMARHMIARGARRLLAVVGTPEHLGHQARCAGAVETWQHNLSRASAQTAELPQVSDEQLRTFTKEADGAIIASSDGTAFAIWRRLLALGIVVPDRVRLSGFDGEEYTKSLGITTGLFDHVRMASTAFAALGHLAQGVTPAILKRIPFILHVGTSS